MTCTHKAIKSVNCVYYCADCGIRLPDDWLVKNTPAQENAPETQPAAPERKKRGKTK